MSSLSLYISGTSKLHEELNHWRCHGAFRLSIASAEIVLAAKIVCFATPSRNELRGRANSRYTYRSCPQKAGKQGMEGEKGKRMSRIKRESNRSKKSRTAMTTHSRARMRSCRHA